MFRQVYFHRTLRSAEAVLRSALRRSLELVERGEEVWCATGTAFEKIMRRQSLSITEHLSMDDSDVIFHMKQWQQSSDEVLSNLSRRFVNRQLFSHRSDMPPMNEEISWRRRATWLNEPDSRLSITSSKIARGCSLLSLLHRRRDRATHAHLCRRWLRASPDTLNQRSERVVRGLGRYELHRICFPAEVKMKSTVFIMHLPQNPIRWRCPLIKPI
jgi:HD superfamily phosphohydrolase